jgi:ribonuclease Z
MHSRFHPRLINGPFDDPALYIPFLFENRAILFDLGDIHALSAKDILKISHIFVTHTHMDHFIGFDQLLRISLGREKILHLYGPQNFIQNVEGKLAAYTWNLVGNYKYRLALQLTEVHRDHLLTGEYLCQNEFKPSRKAVKHPFEEILYEGPAYAVSAAILDHGIPCLGFAIQERFHININKSQVDSLGLDTGPWLTEFKHALYGARDPESEFEIKDGHGETQHFMLGELAQRIALITPGQKISYIVDAAYNPANTEKIISLAKNSDHLFIEAAFLEQHKDIAAEKNHLTARQAGILAARARVKQFSICHFSPRYAEQDFLLQKQALEAYEHELNHVKDG